MALALAICVARLRRRLDLVAFATHELRGPATAIGLAAATLRREPGGIRPALAFESELERLRRGLADLDAARAGRRAGAHPAPLPLERLLRGTAAGWRPAAQLLGRRLRFDWRGGPAIVRADRGRMAQAFGNLVANAVEHGSGEVEVTGRSYAGAVVVEVKNGRPAHAKSASEDGHDRGRGLRIARRAVEEAGGTLLVRTTPQGTTASVRLPAIGDDPPP